MNEKSGLVILACVFFIFTFSFLIAGTLANAKNLKRFMDYQQRVNETVSVQDRQQSSEIRQLKQDAQIAQRLFTSKEFLQEDKE